MGTNHSFPPSFIPGISERFGTRGRPYLVHNARAIPLPLLHEASLTFPKAFSSTAMSRFRGQNDSMPETHTLWLATHFIIERHREVRSFPNRFWFSTPLRNIF